MAFEVYADCVLTSRPRFNSRLQLWVPYASIAWAEQNKSRYHELEIFPEAFESEAEAVHYGFVAARAWIHDHESQSLG
jgi:hypothetical protein